MDTLLTTLRAAGEGTRLRILVLLGEGELMVGELVQILEQSQPRVSRHLKLLSDAGLIDRLQEGTQVFYRLSDRKIAKQFVNFAFNFVDRDSEALASDARAANYIRSQRFERAQAYFKDNADSWNEIRSLYVSEAEVEAALLAMVGSRKGLDILDVGTGTGRMLELFSPLASSALGIDVSREMLAVARSQLAAKQLNNCHVQLGDMYDLPVKPDSKDLIIFHQVLHYAEQPQKAIAEAAKSLKQDGKLIIVDFAPHDREFLRDQHAHRRLGFAEQEMTGWAEKADIKATDVKYLDGGELTIVLWCFEK
ncbi:metalloregulator ArsR/SmtB family transcription factor [Kordiimonas sp. SCSIO 12610]|uniref:ArsR/SmtB family transcription factor n=1 Tax=Kordiimonas sp. SCSIO 12610 TaxID=2829597 RepID=UPI00210B0AAA|nr:metalloregulator ArsR/SmtB family transcription factor [Kordiimonas sp. SCSIO 12610]UTW54476.1 metalloregulator ArsR/SmtB family transcription factor [Kordiimonas sp. SCSIO 12610]